MVFDVKNRLSVAGVLCVLGILPWYSASASIERTAAIVEPSSLSWLLAPVDTTRGLKVFAVAALLAMAASALRSVKR